MQVLAQNLDIASLTSCSREAAQLLCASNFDSLASRFGYALAFDRPLAEAIRLDLEDSLAELGASALEPYPSSAVPSVSVFGHDTTGVLAAVGCRIPTNNGRHVLLELVVTAANELLHVTIEQVSGAA